MPILAKIADTWKILNNPPNDQKTDQAENLWAKHKFHKSVHEEVDISGSTKLASECFDLGIE